MSELRTDPGADKLVAGLTSGIVTNNHDPDGLGRVKLRFFWHEDEQESDWARVATPMAGRAFGLFFLPEVGDEVLVGFDRGDIRFPYVIGSLWSQAAKPPETNADGKNDIRIIHTRKGHTLLFDDGDEGRIEMRLSDGKSIVIDDHGILIDDKANRIALDCKGGTVAIEAKEELTLGAPKISMFASTAVELNGRKMLG